MAGSLSTSLRKSAALLGVLILLVLVFGLTLDRFLTLATLRSVLNQIPAITFAAVGMTYVLMTGGIDLSTGSVLALTSAAVGVMMAKWGWSLPVVIPAALLIGAACGSLNGAVTVAARIPSFIVTLGMLQAARGLALLSTQSRPVFIGRPVEWLAAPISGLGVSIAFLIAISAVVSGHVVLRQTVFGRYCTALGSNEQALKMSGVDARWIRVLVFLLSGLCASIAGIIETSRLSAGSPGEARGFELLAIASAVIGGTSLSGGRGSVVSTFLGVLIITVLQQGLAHAGAGEGTKYVITGTVTVLAVCLDSWRSRQSE
ncbi:MAG: ABC transporter permease [Planctomycetaceae bacterium]